MRICLFVITSLWLFPMAVTAQDDHVAFSERVDERRALVYREIASYPGIAVNDEQVLKAMFRVPRHAFVPSDFQPYAYQNRPLPIGYGQTISQPVIVASMTDLLEIESGQKILEIGTGSGYQAAVLAELETEVYTIEIVRELGEKARSLLQELGYENVHVKVGDGYEGWPEEAPFDRIIVTCAPENVPVPLVEQLKPDGRIVIPVGNENATQYLEIMIKNRKGKLVREMKYPVRFVPMTGKARKKN